MTAIDDAIKKCNDAIKLASELQSEVYTFAQHQRLIGIMLGIVITAGALLLVTRF